MNADDTANKVSDLETLLYSTHKRVEIAEYLQETGKDELLPTALEDLYCGVQLILDHCIKED